MTFQLPVVREPTPVDLEKNLEDIFKERRRRLRYCSMGFRRKTFRPKSRAKNSYAQC